MKALDKWVHLMIQLNMIKKNKATQALPLYFCWYVSHRCTLSHTHTHALYYPGPFTLPSSMAVCAAICTDMWLSSQSQQHTQSLLICSKPNVHNPRAGLTPRLLQNTHQHSQRLIHCDVTCKHQPAGMIVS